MSEERPIRVLLADDQPLMVTALATIIDAESDIDVVASVANGAAALHELDVRTVDVAVLDIRMPVLDGVEATRRMKARDQAPRVLILTTFNEDELVRAALEAGADGFLLKDASPEELTGAIRRVGGGEFVVSSAASGHLVRAYLEVMRARRDPVSGEARRGLDLLTGREAEVLSAVADGASNAEIAALLFIGEATVKTHVSSLLAKLQCRDRIALAVLAHRAHLR